MNNPTESPAGSPDGSPDESQVFMLDYTVKFIIVLVITVLVYVCNIIVMVVLYCSSTIPYHQKYLMCSLCCTDLSMAVLLTLSLVTSSYDNRIFGDQMCQIATLVLYVVINVSFLTLAVMILDKYLLVRYPMKYQRLATKKVVIFCVICIWFWSTLTLILLRTFWKNTHFYNNNLFVCVSMLNMNEDAPAASIYNFCTSLLPSLLIGGVSNVKIYMISTRQHNCVCNQKGDQSEARVNVKGLRTIMIASGLAVMSSAHGFVITIIRMFTRMPPIAPTVQFFLYYAVICNSFANCFI